MSPESYRRQVLNGIKAASIITCGCSRYGSSFAGTWDDVDAEQSGVDGGAPSRERGDVIAGAGPTALDARAQSVRAKSHVGRRV